MWVGIVNKEVRSLRANKIVGFYSREMCSNLKIWAEKGHGLIK
jgi:hypothetical protein